MTDDFSWCSWKLKLSLKSVLGMFGNGVKKGARTPRNLRERVQSNIKDLNDIPIRYCFDLLILQKDVHKLEIRMPNNSKGLTKTMLFEKRVLKTVGEYAQYILKKLQEIADRYCIVMLFNGKEMHKLEIQVTKNAALL